MSEIEFVAPREGGGHNLNWVRCRKAYHLLRKRTRVLHFRVFILSLKVYVSIIEFCTKKNCTKSGIKFKCMEWLLFDLILP
jgi:hypothetical protein